MNSHYLFLLSSGFVLGVFMGILRNAIGFTVDRSFRGLKSAIDL